MVLCDIVLVKKPTDMQSFNSPSLRAPARPLMTVTGLAGLVQNWCSGGKKASLLFSNCRDTHTRKGTIVHIKAIAVENIPFNITLTNK